MSVQRLTSASMAYVRSMTEKTRRCGSNRTVLRIKMQRFIGFYFQFFAAGITVGGNGTPWRFSLPGVF